MRGNFINWLYVLEENLHPNVLNKAAKHHSGLTHYFDDLTKSTQQFKPYFLNIISRSKPEAKAVLLQLTIVSNTIHNYMVAMAGSRKEYPFSRQVNQLYLQTLVLLDMLLEFCGRLDKHTLSELPVTAYSIPSIRMQLKRRLNIVRNIIAESDIEPILGELVLRGLKRLIERQGMSRSDAKYASIILEELKKLQPFTTIEVENLLYQYDFNTPAFFNYCAKCCTRVIIDTPSLHEQLEVLIGLEDRISSLPARCTSRWMAKDKSIREQIMTLLTEKKQYIQQRIELRRLEIQDTKLNDETERAQVNLPVAQFGLLIRLFMEKGLLPKEEVGKTFAYYARHFSTPKTPFISAESLQKKSTDVEFSTAKKMKGHLIGMVNWLNEHYNVSNHRDS
ncbi:hypothetical protein BC792_112102 [Sphingobacterium allocomposti]|uniref:Uncharacterized protein n=1 Tax=Sphingobacterium allocomposti TaxID=415956 RepID=A0A5S5DGG6_9SPHI|nr:hypothetical protein [Sphingobacterium composti Yoo et al. 2007 non Ten et al. 2007]TYP94438.1 hypothetical protein BC792_112102 [Sphingobacterium composti Yoo et al. 2007 non Ten et al. 2007]